MVTPAEEEWWWRLTPLKLVSKTSSRRGECRTVVIGDLQRRAAAPPYATWKRAR